MKMNTAKKRTGAGLILMILGAALILAGTVMTLRLRNGIFEYVVPAPAGESAADRLEEISGLLSDYEWSAAVRTQEAGVSRGGSGITVTLYAVSEGWFDLHHETLAEGRAISGEDVRSRRKSAVINQAAASALFQGLDPTGQSFSCGSGDFEVVGVVKGGYRIGETADAVVWIPVTLADPESTLPSTMEIRAFSGSQAQSVVLKNLLAQWSPGGTAFDHRRLRLTAFMPLWLLGAAAGFLLLRTLFSAAFRKGKLLARGIREMLKDRYPGQMKARILGTALLIIAGAALLAAGTWLWLTFAMMPLYTFTDWIPEALVDPDAVSLTVKTLLTGAAASAQYRSADAAAMGMFSAWIAAGTILFSAGLCVRLIARCLKRTGP